MSDNRDKRSNSGGVGTVLLLLLLVGGLILAGGAAFVWFRSQALEQAAMEAREAQMRSQARRAWIAAERARARNWPEERDFIDGAADQQEPDQEIAITLNAQGEIAIHGSPVSAEHLKDELLQLTHDQPDEWRITIWPDEDSDVLHLTDLLARCKEAGFSNVQIAAKPPAREQ